MVRHLLDAVWYGSSALNVIYSRTERGEIVPVDWIPFNPDVLIVHEDGTPGIKVGPRYYGEMGGTGGETQQGFDSRVHLFTDIERRAVLWHRYMVQGPDFDDPYETAYSYMGKGVRDVVWWYWNLKQAVLQNWATYAERYAQGIRVGYYPMAQKGGKEEMETILRNLVGDVSAVVPRTTPGQKGYEIEIKEPGAARAQVFADLTEWLAKNIKELIVGQSATSEAVSTGLGSSVGKEHSKTFTRQMKFVADGLAEGQADQSGLARKRTYHRVSSCDPCSPPCFAWLAWSWPKINQTFGSSISPPRKNVRWSSAPARRRCTKATRRPCSCQTTGRSSRCGASTMAALPDRWRVVMTAA